MGKYLLCLVLSQIATNGFWYLVVTETSFKESPLWLLPIFATAGLVAFCLMWIMDNWEV